MASIRARVKEVEGKIGDIRSAELYDWAGNHVPDTEVIKWPSKTSCGMAMLPDGIRREITPTVSMKEVILAAAHYQSSKTHSGNMEAADAADKYKETLFLRKDGVPGFYEILYSQKHGRGIRW